MSTIEKVKKILTGGDLLEEVQRQLSLLRESDLRETKGGKAKDGENGGRENRSPDFLQKSSHGRR